MEKESAGGPAIAMIVSGVVGLFYALFYFLWTLWPLLWGVLAMGTTLSDKGLGSDFVAATLMFFGTPAFQTLLFLVTVITALITIFAGIRFNQWRSRGLVWLGVICSLATPVLGAIGNSASLFNCGTVGVGIFGCILGNLGTLPVFILGLIASVWGTVVLFSDAADAFDEP